MPTQTSVSGVLSLLQEPDQELKIYALNQLAVLVDEFWAEISDHLKTIESLHEDISFDARELAALVASKVYYHLGAFSESITFALGAGQLFDVNAKSEYVDTIIAKCIDEYIAQRVKQAEEDQQNTKIDERLENIVERMFERCFQDGEYKQAIGIALETRRLDKLEQSIARDESMISYALQSAMTLVSSRDFRQQVLRSLVSLYNSLKTPDYFGVTQCLIFLNDAKAVGETLRELITADDAHTKHLIAYQIAFDLVDRATQRFIHTVKTQLTGGSSDTETKSNKTAATETSSSTTETPETFEGRLEKLLRILSGQVSIELYVDFLFRLNRTDTAILKNIKGSFEPRVSILHSATVTANALMHAGTTNDSFLRDNLEWLSRAANWAKFSAASSLGVIHKGQVKHAMTILSPYLPAAGAAAGAGAGAGNVTGTSYSEGGSLYALGLIHSVGGATEDTQSATTYLLQQLRATKNEVVQHGACLGLGLTAMASENMEIYDELRNVLFLDNAVAGEAAGIAMGLVMLGSSSASEHQQQVLEDMLGYAHETQHEKIIRGLAIGLALTAYGREEDADTLIEQLTGDKDPLLRYGGMFAIGLAYVGTGNNRAVRKLLHVAVSDVSDDVRRAAVTNLGFLQAKSAAAATQTPRLVRLLAESYNPHVRYGATLAVGISCAGGGPAMKEAVELLEPLLKDPVDFVRQGAMIAQAMVLVQASDEQPAAAALRTLCMKTVGDRHEEIMTKMGAVLAAGILDAGGRNVTIALHKSGHTKLRAVVGLALFAQYWFWHPFIHFVSLALEPTAIIALNKDLKMPQFKLKSNARPSLFAYPAPVSTTTEKTAVTRAPAAVLSTTKKAQQQQAAKDKEKERRGSITTPTTVPTPTDTMDLDKPAATTSASASTSKTSGSKATTTGTATGSATKEKEKEPLSQELENPARVTLAQLNHISFDIDPRYTPIKMEKELGIVMLSDKQPSEPETIVDFKSAASATAADEDEVPPPEPFEWSQ